MTSMQFEVESIHRLEIKAGETLVVRVPVHTRPEQVEALGALIRERLPEDVKCLFVSADVEFEVVAST